jgi:hypothetical protein
MLSSQQIQEFEIVSERFGVHKLPDEEAECLYRKILDRYVEDPSRLWMWESLKTAAQRISYGDNEDWCLKFSEICRGRGSMLLMITDDEPEPYPVFSGQADSILAMLKECYSFEYILAEEDLSWLMFDTHMCEFMIVKS